ncbi:MAG: hypothetical protein LBT97_09060 [Planctomycetota bacterium]|jgi:hypothetical protein|nr:hypothetical protein [Planctomycetota bacterium]
MRDFERDNDPRYHPPIPPSGLGDSEEFPDFLDGAPIFGDAGSTAKPVCRPADMELCEVSDLCRKALVEAHASPDLPHVYNFNGVCATVDDAENGGKTIRNIAASASGSSILAVLLTRLVAFIGRGANNRDRPVKPPDKAVMDILARPEGLPRLEGLVDIPTFRKDGSLIQDAGYDSASRLYYAPAMPAEFESLPEIPTQDNVRDALAALRKPFASFPFENGAAWSNFLGLLFTPIARPFISGNVPLIAISSNVQGAGKTTLAACLGIIAGEKGYCQMTAPERSDDDEIRKRLTASLMLRPRILAIDNTVGKFDSPTLASLLTTETWSDRRLGSSEMISFPMRAVVVVTGVNITIAGDLSRRTVMLRLEAKDEKPWERQFPFEPQDYVRKNRGELVRALIILIRNWEAAGRPLWNRKRLGSFEAWCATIGGILAAAGVDDFLADWDGADSAASQELEELDAFLQAFANEFRSNGVASGKFAERARAPDSEHLRNNLPEALRIILDQKEGRAAIKVTGFFKSIRNRVAGGKRLVSDYSNHDKMHLWRVDFVDPEPAAGI